MAMAGVVADLPCPGEVFGVVVAVLNGDVVGDDVEMAN
jgi:hypothetical protein